MIGGEWKSWWEKHVRESWERYAHAHGYDIVVIDDYIDDSERGQARTPHWQKCLVLEHADVKRYEDVVWLDADILVNFHAAPCIVAHNGSDRIGVVSHNDAYATRERIENSWNRMHRHGSGIFFGECGPTPIERYRQAGLGDEADDMTNTGVLVLKPGRHGDLLRHVYDTYEENAASSNEEKFLSYEIFRRGLFNRLDPRFNRWWLDALTEDYPFLLLEENHRDVKLVAYCVNAAWHNSYFLHFISDGYSRPDVQLIALEAGDAIDFRIR